MVIKIKKNSIKTAAIMIFIILMENCFYLINTDDIHITGAFAYSDIWLVLLFVYFGYQFIKYRKIKTDYYFGPQVIFLVLLVFVSAIQQNILTGQGLWLGIRPQRSYLLILLTYFPLRKMFSAMKISVDDLMNALMSIGTLSAVLYLVQKLTIDHIQFLHVIMNERNGERFYVDSTLIQVAVIIAIFNFCKEYKIKYLFNLLICVAYEFWVSQGRLEIMAVLVTVTIGFLMTRKMNKKKLAGICLLVLIVFIFMNTSYADELWKSISTMTTATSAEGNTMEIRYIGRSRYAKQLSESIGTFLFGCGYPSLLYAPAAIKAGYNLNIGLNDNGIFGFTYIYGYVGLIVIVVLMIKFIKKSYVLYKFNNNTIYLMYMILNICLAYNIIFWYWKPDGTFIMILMLCIIEHLNKNLVGKRNDE